VLQSPSHGCCMSDDSADERSGLGSIDGGDEFEYEEEHSNGGSLRASPAHMDGSPKNATIQNQPHDEEVELSDEGSVDSPVSGTAGSPGHAVPSGNVSQVENQPFDEAINVSDDESVMSQETGSKASPDASAMAQSAALDTPVNNRSGAPLNDGSDSSTESSSESDDGPPEDDEDGSKAKFTGVEGGYNPKEFENLEVSEEIKNLFDYISRYQPHQMELESVLMPFIPDYIPSVGDIDAFIKLPRPDGKADQLGITVVDEPALVSSDPGVIEMQMRQLSKNVNVGAAEVHNIQNAEKNPKAIKSFLKSIDELHSKKPPTEVMYSRAMPDIESLMQVWPPQFEDELARTPLPSKDLDVSLEDYIRIVCTLFDIPVYNNLTESLHVFFSLYSEFKNNDHFRNEMDAAMSPGGGNNAGAADHFGGGFGPSAGPIGGGDQFVVGGSMLSPGKPKGFHEEENVMAM